MMRTWQLLIEEERQPVDAELGPGIVFDGQFKVALSHIAPGAHGVL